MNERMDAILRLDIRLFHIINARLTSATLDSAMPFISEKFNFLGAIIAAAVLILVLGKRQDRVGLLVLVAVVLASDLLSNVLKHAFMRIRPCSALEGVRLLAGCGSSYSMPSSHAANIFAAMVFLTARYRRFFPLFLPIAFAVSYSRVYLGVHYPTDVLTGALLGACVGIGFFAVEKAAVRKYAEHRSKKGGGVEV